LSSWNPPQTNKQANQQTVPSVPFGIFSKLYEQGGERGHTWI
jgi:hypothetical protein